MIPDEIYKYRLIRELVELELPSLIQRHQMKTNMTDQELLDELAKPNVEAIRLLTEAAGTVEASTTEIEISDDRKNYRRDLLERIKTFLKSQAS